ncbi:hypothetical protein BDV12DRAFT_191832 [Aspergillus spectabilis]
MSDISLRDASLNGSLDGSQKGSQKGQKEPQGPKKAFKKNTQNKPQGERTRYPFGVGLPIEIQESIFEFAAGGTAREGDYTSPTSFAHWRLLSNDGNPTKIGSLWLFPEIVHFLGLGYLDKDGLLKEAWAKKIKAWYYRALYSHNPPWLDDAMVKAGFDLVKEENGEDLKSRAADLLQHSNPNYGLERR